MPSQSPLPDNEHELSAYGPSAHASGSSSSYPLLSIPNGHSSPPPIARKKRRSSTSRTVPRWWKPITIASALILLILIYAVVHPNIPGLPALQRVVLQSGSDSANHPSSVYPSEDSNCTCGHTKEGERLCGVYHREALRTTRLVQGTGARVRRMLLAAREGKALKVGVLGGSGVWFPSGCEADGLLRRLCV